MLVYYFCQTHCQQIEFKQVYRDFLKFKTNMKLLPDNILQFLFVHAAYKYGIVFMISPWLSS